MSDLVAFLRACLDADEAAARAAYDEAGDYRVVGSELAELHFVRWKPDRVLADVAAKRAMVERHDAGMSRVVPGVRLCPSCAAGQSEHFTEHGCLTLRLLAQPYEGADGWDPAWKMDT